MDVNQNIPPFFIGQEIVAVLDHHLGYFSKHERFVVLGIKRFCHSWAIDIGFFLHRNSEDAYCKKCNHKLDVNTMAGEKAWISSKFFSPIIKAGTCIAVCDGIEYHSSQLN